MERGGGAIVPLANTRPRAGYGFAIRPRTLPGENTVPCHRPPVFPPPIALPHERSSGRTLHAQFYVFQRLRKV